MTASFPGSVKNFTDLVDGVDEMEAANVNDAYAEIESIESELAAELPRGGYANTETLADTLALADTDPALQYLDPGGAARDVTLPAEGNANHLFVIVNTADAAETITVKDDGANTIGTVAQGEVKIFVSNSVAWKVVSGGGSTLSKATAADVTAGTDDDKYTTSKALKDAGIVAVTVREILTGNRTYYVRTNGNDSNTGLENTSGGAFLTIQKAIDVAAALDCSLYNITIQVADGTYVANTITLKNIIGSGSVTIQGNSGTPANVVIDGGFSKATPGTTYTVKDLKIIKSSGSAIIGILSQGCAKIQFSNIDFGAGLTYQLYATQMGNIVCTGNYSITGAAGYHVLVRDTSFVSIESKTVTITGTPAFTAYCYAINFGNLIANGCTFSGSATGQRYNVSINSLIFTNGGGANYFPGNSAGAAATGGLYA